MIWKVDFIDEAMKDLKKFDGSQRKIVFKAIEKTSQNPLSIYEGGYGKPLGVKFGIDLSGLFKIKLKKSGIRIVYQLIKEDERSSIVIIGLRADESVYKNARLRMDKYK